MNRQLSLSCDNQFFPMHSYSHQLNEQFLCMKTKPIIRNSSIINQNLFLESHNPYILSSICHHPSHDLNKTQIFRSNSSSLSTINRHLSMPSYDQFSSMHHRFEEDYPLRIHVGNIPFLWTIDDLCKQFLGFGFITFLRHSDGLNAIRVKNGSIADGRKITHLLDHQLE
ncbi:unnamed protein product [Rotaria sp. Silwood2]|nr:unnamed protein product [Rotaria sp. Silwood2]CAF3877456.1 unnamed protein product [Rotaria sp. Silwood2]CAF3885833.1 unnamed protein product [Rotaria sp. Silwood2]CAF4153783.1 unnamed protein product [Rotaria sp. Silwood2]